MKRMLADAQFLHQKLSVLKNVSAPTNMLETLVSEKPIPRKSTLGNTRTTASPNERLRGLLSRRDSTKPDKPLPSLSQPLSSPGVISLPTASSNGATVDDSDRVIPPPRSSSRSPGAVSARSEAPMTMDGSDIQGNALQSEEEVAESSNPISSMSSLQGGIGEPRNGNDEAQPAALPS